jgi:SET domain-containing protein
MTSHSYLPVKSYVSPKVIIHDSKIHNLGMFAKHTIEKGEIVFIKGGHIVSKGELYFDEPISSYLPIDDQFFIGAVSKEEEEAIKLFLNHSCEPNCGVRGEITFVALRRIEEGEELTCDYAMIDNEDYEFECKCGSDACRKRITGFDWKISDLQVRYSNYFARYLIDKMTAQRDNRR